MIRLTNILSERHKQTPNERISKYKERIQHLKDKISKAKDSNSDTVKLQKNQIRVIQQTMNNFKQSQAIKKQKSETKLSEILKENVLQELLGYALVQFAIWTIGTVIRSFRNKSEYKKFTQEPHIKWLDRVGNNTNFNKYIYYTIKNDKKLKEFEKEIETARNNGQKHKIDFSKLQYERDLIKRWLDSKIAQKELDKVFKELHPDKTYDSRDIPLPGSHNQGMISTYKQWKNTITKQAIKEWSIVLNDGTTKRFLNKFAKSEGLPAI